jgi:hypothetical protein
MAVGIAAYAPSTTETQHARDRMVAWSTAACERNLAKASTNGADLCAVATTNLAVWAFRSSSRACYVFVVSTGGAGALDVDLA